LIVAPLVMLVISNADVLLILIATRERPTRDMALAMGATVPLSAAACGLTVWLLLRLRREIDKRGVTESKLRTALDERGTALANLSSALDREQMLRRELDHRVRNNLASLMGLIGVYEDSQTGRDGLAQALRGKISALREVYGLIGTTHGEGIDLAELLRTVIEGTLSAAGAAPLEMTGPGVRLMSREANAMAMIAQELATNSVKYGALRSAGGLIRISWEAEEADGRETTLRLRWVESPLNGARVQPAEERTGIGLALIEGFARGDLHGDVTFAAAEGRWTVELLANLSRAGEVASKEACA
jgi:two-component sensor histidine kinase